MRAVFPNLSTKSTLALASTSILTMMASPIDAICMSNVRLLYIVEFTSAPVSIKSRKMSRSFKVLDSVRAVYPKFVFAFRSAP